MKYSLRRNQDSEGEVEFINVEIRIKTMLSELSTESLQHIEQAIVASVSSVLKRSSKKTPKHTLISNLTIYNPNYSTETRYLVNVCNNYPSAEEEEKKDK